MCDVRITPLNDRPTIEDPDRAFRILLLVQCVKLKIKNAPYIINSSFIFEKSDYPQA